MSYHCSILSLALIFSFCIYPIVGATFDAKSFFLYIDQSCTDLDTINNAADDMNAMVAAAQESFDWSMCPFIFHYLSRIERWYSTIFFSGTAKSHQ